MEDNELRERGNEMVALLALPDEELRRQPAGTAGVAANDLIALVRRGFPVENIVPLLQSDATEVVETGLWIADELAGKALGIVDEIVLLLDHEDWMLSRSAGVILSQFDDLKSHTIATIVSLLKGRDDLELKSSGGEIADCVLRILRKVPHEQLGEVADAVDDECLAELLRWLRDEGNDAGAGAADRIAERLAGPDRLGRVFAAAAAARIGNETTVPLEQAVRSDIDVISEFAQWQLEFGAPGGGGLGVERSRT